jgi:hypothetical protein
MAQSRPSASLKLMEFSRLTVHSIPGGAGESSQTPTHSAL